MPRDLTNHVMIITGASSGIGAATAIAAAQSGMDLVITARRADKLQEVAAKINGRGRNVAVVAGDAADPGMADRLLDEAMSRFGRFDFVFANAGYGLYYPTHELSDAAIREMFEINFFAGLDLLRKSAARLMQQRRPGHLLMCSSCLAKFTIPMHGMYCATKAAQNHICRAMNIELRPHIHVSSVHPIGTKTEFFEASAKRTGDDRVAQGMLTKTPRMFMQPPERVANAVIGCLRRPKPEVWTSLTVRLGAAVMTAFPGIGDFLMREAERRVERPV